jgi:hypothetical protein
MHFEAMQESELKSHGVWQLLSQASEALEQYPDDQQRTVEYLDVGSRTIT